MATAQRRTQCEDFGLVPVPVLDDTDVVVLIGDVSGKTSSSGIGGKSSSGRSPTSPTSPQDG